jgi:hypothetical protein
MDTRKRIGLAATWAAALAGLAFGWKSTPSAAGDGRWVVLLGGGPREGGQPIGVRVGTKEIVVYDAEGPRVAWDPLSRRRREIVGGGRWGKLERLQRVLFPSGDADPVVIRFEVEGPIAGLGGWSRPGEDRGPSWKASQAPGRLAAVSPDGSQIYVLDHDEHCHEIGRLTAIDADRGPGESFERPGLFGLRVSEDGSRVLALHPNRSSLLDGRGLTLLDELPAAHDARLSPDGRSGVLLARQAAILWSKAGRPRRIDFPSSPVDAALDPGSGRVAIVSATRFALVELGSGVVLRQHDLPDDRARLRSVVLFPDGGRWAVGSLEIRRGRDGRATASALVRVTVDGVARGTRSEASFETTAWTASSPELRLLPQGDLLVTTPDAARVLELPR